MNTRMVIIGIIFVSITSFISLILDVVQSAENSAKMYTAFLSYNRQTKEVMLTEEVAVSKGYPDKDVPGGAYRYDVISGDGEILYSARFHDPSLLEISVHGNSEHPGKIVQRPVENFVMFVPYFPNGHRINIYDEVENLKLSIDISH